MIETLWEVAVKEGGIWCVLCIYLILHQQRKYTDLEKWVKTEVIAAITASTTTMIKIEEFLKNAKRDDRDN
jgi:hypothetical protein